MESYSARKGIFKATSSTKASPYYRQQGVGLDQHAYMQQLRDGVNNFFVTFIEVLKDREAKASLEVEPGITSGDFLQGFYLGTRDALSEKDRHSVTITLPDVSPRSIGMLIALYERAVGHCRVTHRYQRLPPAGRVEAGKSAGGVIAAETPRSPPALKGAPGKAFTKPRSSPPHLGPARIKTELVFKILEHLARQPQRRQEARPARPGTSRDIRRRLDRGRGRSPVPAMLALQSARSGDPALHSRISHETDLVPPFLIALAWRTCTTDDSLLLHCIPDMNTLKKPIFAAPAPRVRRDARWLHRQDCQGHVHSVEPSRRLGRPDAWHGLGSLIPAPAPRKIRPRAGFL